MVGKKNKKLLANFKSFYYNLACFCKVKLMLIKIFVFCLSLIITYLVISYRYEIIQSLGRISFLEDYFGSTELGIVFFSVLIFFLILLYLTGGLDVIFQNTIYKFF
jgi:hypothetical protein